MNTATKVIGIGIVTLIALGMRKKKTITTTETVVQQNIKSNLDYEGKVVVQDNGNWFVVKNGKRWFTGSVEAIVDFQTANPGSEAAIQNVPESELERYPIAGHIEAGLNFLPTGGKLSNPLLTNFIGV